MSFSDFTHSFSAVEAAAHGGHVIIVVDTFIALCMSQLLLVLIIEGL